MKNDEEGLDCEVNMAVGRAYGADAVSVHVGRQGSDQTCIWVER